MENTSEIWKPIKDYEGLYEVSNMGRVRSLSRKGTFERILNPCVRNTGGYLAVNLYKNGKKTMYFIHRLVALAFLPNPNNYPVINHKDCNPSNNCVDNLEWCTVTYNNTYNDKAKKQALKKSKPIKQLALDGTLIAIWPSINEIGRNGFIQQAVCACCQGKRKTHNGFIWKYK